MITKTKKQTTIVMLTLLALAAFLAACGGPAAAEPEALRSIEVQDVRVEIGVGSPIPVTVNVAGQWPDTCAQLVEVNQTVAGNVITIEILTTPADPACPPDFVGVPFGMAVPLNSVGLEPGVYQVQVNGVSAEFQWGQ